MALTKDWIIRLINIHKIDRHQVMDLVVGSKDNDIAISAIKTGKLNREDLLYIKEKFPDKNVQGEVNEKINICESGEAMK